MAAAPDELRQSLYKSIPFPPRWFADEFARLSSTSRQIRTSMATIR